MYSLVCGEDDLAHMNRLEIEQ